VDHEDISDYIMYQLKMLRYLHLGCLCFVRISEKKKLLLLHAALTVLNSRVCKIAKSDY